MDLSARRFARRILLIHVLLLLAVASVIALATRAIYRHSQQQALDHATRRQELLARQTAVGLAGYYASILDNLDLAQRDFEGDEGPSTRPFLPATVPLARTAPILLWNQLQRRVAYLAVVDRDARGAQFRGAYPPEETAHAMAVVSTMAPWLNRVKGSEISRFQNIKGRTVNLVSVTAPLSKTRLLVAVVPLEYVRSQFLEDVGGPGQSVRLLADAGQLMASSGDAALAAPADRRYMQVMHEARAVRHTVTRAFRHQESPDGQRLVPALSTAEPVNLVRGVPGAIQSNWWLVLCSSLVEVDSVINSVFRNAVLWAGFLVASVTAILLSTALQLIRSRVRSERQRVEILDRELLQARRIQLAWLPELRSRPISGRVEVAAVNQPASHISGDFYDWFELPGRTPGCPLGGCQRTVVTIGDVTGHGMAAAFLMATTQLLIRSTMLRVGDPGKCLEEVNRQLCVQVFNGQFVTALILVLHADEGIVQMASAGHFAPLTSSSNGFAPLPLESQLVLGVERDVNFTTQRLALEPDSRLLLYTDGVIDVHSNEGERFSTQRLARAVAESADGAQGMLRQALDAVNEFRAGQPLADDLTLVAVRLRPMNPS